MFSFYKSQPQPYSTLREDEAYADSPSLDGEKMESPRPSIARRRVGWLAPALIGATLAVAVTVLFMQNFVVMSRNEAEEIYHSMVPKFPVDVKRFTHGEIYAETGPEADAAWHALAGPTEVGNKFSQQGFIQVDPSLKFSSLEPGYMVGGKQKYGISMYHQLHCLGAIRGTVLSLLDGTLDAETFLAQDQNVTSPDFFPTGYGFWHLKHCFDYVRQALQCAGDMSVEWPTQFNGEPIVVGWNMPHKCMNWDNAWQWMEENA